MAAKETDLKGKNGIFLWKFGSERVDLHQKICNNKVSGCESLSGPSRDRETGPKS